MMLKLLSVLLLTGLNPPDEIYSPTFSSIKGKVVDETGIEVVVGATITIEDLDIETITDFEGVFAFQNIKPGSYTLKISFPSYKTVNINNLSVGKPEIDLLINLQ